MHLHDYIKATPLSDPRFVETWYSRHDRNYVTQIKDSNRDQIDEAIYSGNKQAALNAHWRAVFDCLADVPHGCVATVALTLK